MDTIGVIGAGVMGCGVAQSFAQLGYSVILIDISESILDKAKEEIYKNVRLQGFFNKSENLLDPEVVLSKIHFSTDYKLLENVNFIIENVTEKWEIKEEVYKKIDSICKDNCIFLVNTSCISITKVAALTKRPSQVLGAHFMNPVPIKSTVEVIRGYHTSNSTIDAIRDLLKTIGKEIIVVNDYPGFVSNRISHLFMNEAAFVVQDQVSSAEEVDNIFKKCYSHKMGPLETADLIGLDTVVHSLDVLYQTYQDSKFRCCPLLRKMVEAGLLGRKSGKGFYSYQ
ncbi:hypothetical protein B4102_3275 [Heyndrickxia sporothermodurans]|uniref:3-hydroxybutyryl-CoA dehydrogenase n=1 Tax=Heyndrickxia sporothermodurans TaxID=46224 RepID=A0A150KX82_9BACI|nr:3-hydroxyacyl-CoA dehydrogenase family protein [Heyndrickxia sporothermodurans]KYD04429.1 hypothetical protein B4102_3275 [Heyndrickxia sporothermodurans]